MKRRIFAIFLLILAFGLLILAPVLAFTSPGQQLLVNSSLLAPSPTSIPPSPTAIPTQKPVLTAQGQPPSVNAKAAYLVDMDTGNVLLDNNGEKSLPMASTTKIMTALIAIQTGNLDQIITVKQDAINRVGNIGSNAGLVVGEQLTLKDLIYALLIPSGDDAAVVIADALAGSPNQFVQRMNLFAERLHLFQTHYANDDGLTADFQTNPDHYTSAADLVRLSTYAMKIPLFAQIVKTQTYTLPRTIQHQPHTWTTTNDLLGTYNGMLGIKTGHTWEAGFCLVFAAENNGHHLIGVVLNSSTAATRVIDAKTLLNWGFSLPTLPPHQS